MVGIIRAFVVRWRRSKRRQEASAYAEFLLTEAHVLSEENRQAMRSMQRQYEERIRNIIQAGIEAGDFVPGNPRLMTFTLLRGSLGVADWYDPSGSWTNEEIVEGVTAQLLRGILSPPLTQS